MKGEELELYNKSITSHTDFDNSLNIPQRSHKYYTEFNRLLYSQRCIYFYIFLIISSVTIFFYSILAYFLNFSELPILVCESILVVIISIDMCIRIYVAGCKAYFKKILNCVDGLLILLNFFTIFMYMKFHNAAQEIEDISFALLIFIRNFSQLLRLFVLIKNQQTISRNVEEIINLNILFEEKKFEILSIKSSSKSNHAISFVNEDIFVKKDSYVGLNTSNEDFSGNEISNL